MRRTILVLLVVPVALVLTAPSALAGGPPYPYEEHNSWNGCGFVVQRDVVGSVVDHFWSDDDGTYRYIGNAPGTKLTLTSKTASITVPYTGNYFEAQTTEGLSVKVAGPWPMRWDPYTGEPGLWLLTGRLTYSIDSEGNETIGLVGRVVDLCPLLAA